MTKTTVAKLKKGEYFKLSESETAPVWIRGEYTLLSFFASLVMHGGLGIMIYCGVDWILRRVFHQIK